MSPELLQLIVNGGGFAVAIWMLNNLWKEQQSMNTWMRTIIDNQQKADAAREAIARAVHAEIPPSAT